MNSRSWYFLLVVSTVVLVSRQQNQTFMLSRTYTTDTVVEGEERTFMQHNVLNLTGNRIPTFTIMIND